MVATAKKVPSARAAKFAQLVAGGKSQSDAYCIAYSRPELKGTQLAAHNGHRIAKRAAPVIEQHRAKSDGATLLSLNARLKILATHAKRKGTSPAHMSAVSRVIETYTKIAGAMPPDRVELSGPAGGPVEVQQSVVNQSMRQKMEGLIAAKKARTIDEFA